jgi:hypothetical protein
MVDQRGDAEGRITRRNFIRTVPVGLGALATAHNMLAESDQNKPSKASSPTGRFVVGIQTHAHDFLHEGTENVIETVRTKAGVNAVLTCATYVKENMHLPHNPKFNRYSTQGGFYFNFDPKLYANSTIKPVRSPEEGVKDFDAIRVVSEACRKKRVRFYAWVSSFNYPQEAPAYPDHQVVAANGQRHTDWFCPNSSVARDFSLRVYEDLVKHYDLDGVFVDRFRFPDDLTTCFCDHCTTKMKDSGLNAERIRQAVLALTQKTSNMSYLALTTLGMSIDPAFYMSELPEFADLVRFKMDTITGYVRSLHERVKSINPRVEVGLDMFSPSVAWQVGQEPTAIAQYCDWIKPMVYHLGDGYYAIRAIREMANQGAGKPQQTYEGVKLTMRAKGIDLPDRFEEFQKTSFPVSWVQTEMELTRKLTGAQKPLYAGLQLWEPTAPNVVVDAIRAAMRARSDGVFLYCYGWSSLENMDAAGITLRQLGLV